jgi:murein DD-endopeptidase MepM/ murein hydrolase activator NlpD
MLRKIFHSTVSNKKGLFFVFCISIFLIYGAVTFLKVRREPEPLSWLEILTEKDLINAYVWPDHVTNGQPGLSPSNEPFTEISEERKPPMGGILVLSNQSEKFVSATSQDISESGWPILKPLQLSNEESLEITSTFGYRLDPIRFIPAMHQGIDFRTPMGTPIIATADGIIQSLGVRPGYGLQIEIRHTNGFTSKYAHTS